MVYYTARGAISSAVDNVRLPDRIKCNWCKKVKGPSAYSKKQQDDLKAKILGDRRFDAAVSEYISCMGCTSQQVVELECYMCGITKDLTKFSKVQRRSGDKAKCWACMQIQEDTEAGRGGSDESSMSEGSSYSDDSDIGTVSGTFASTSISGAGSTTFPSSSSGGVALSSGPASHASTAGPRSSASTASTARSTATQGGSVGVNGKSGVLPPHLRNRPSPPASDAGSETTTTTTASRAPATATNPSTSYGNTKPPVFQQTSGNGKFAKVPKGVSLPPQPPSPLNEPPLTDHFPHQQPPRKADFTLASQDKPAPKPSLRGPLVGRRAPAPGDDVEDDITVESSEESDSA